MKKKPSLTKTVASVIISTVVELTAKNIGVKIPIIKWTNAKFGKCVPDRNTVYIPNYAIKVGVGFLVYYAVHETCHLKLMPHNLQYKAIEQLALAPFELTIKYAGDYPSVLYWRGRPIYQRGGKNGNYSSISRDSNISDYNRPEQAIR